MIGQRLGIAGVGLIGGSIALRARASGAFVTGFDRDDAAARRARERGGLDRIAPDLMTLAAACDLLVIALPVDAAIAALSELVGVEGPALIIDVASVKLPLRQLAARLPRYIGTHPLAGRERGGIEAAQAALFEGAVWTYVPHRDRGLVASVRALIEAMGARAVELEADEHDELVALTSHLPQALSVALAAQIAAERRAGSRVIEMCGPGMMSMLRLARSPADLWSPIVTANASAIARRLRALAAGLVEAADGLDRGDTGPLMSYFEDGRAIADALEEQFPPLSRS